MNRALLLVAESARSRYLEKRKRRCESVQREDRLFDDDDGEGNVYSSGFPIVRHSPAFAELDEDRERTNNLRLQSQRNAAKGDDGLPLAFRT